MISKSLDSCEIILLRHLSTTGSALYVAITTLMKGFGFAFIKLLIRNYIIEDIFIQIIYSNEYLKREISGSNVF